MRFLFKVSILLIGSSLANASSAEGDSPGNKTDPRLTKPPLVGRRISFGSNPAGSEPIRPIRTILTSESAPGSVSMPPHVPLERCSTLTRTRSPPEGTRVNPGSLLSSPCTVGETSVPNLPATPPRRPRALSSALENTPDRPSLYGEYSASSDVVPMIDDVPEHMTQTRLGYSYSDKLLQTLDRKTRELALLQISHDIENYQSAPQQMYAFEIVLDSFMPVGRPPILRVGPVITTRTETSIMEVYGMPDKVIKYQANCQTILGSGSELHPLLREYWISKYVDDEGTKWWLANDPESANQVSPRVFFVSPPASLMGDRTSKTDFAMDNYNRHRCIRAGASVRYMIMERTGSNMEDFMSLHNETTMRIEFKLGMKVLYQLISRLRVLHSINVIHGDVHMGNVVRALGGIRDQFLLIDYGMASFYDPSKPLSEDRVNASPDGSLFGSSILTHWQMMGYEKSFRDDVLRAMMTVGRILNGVDYISVLQQAETSSDGLKQLASYFARGNLFAMPVRGGFDPVDELTGVTDVARALIKGKLTDMRTHVQGIDKVNTKPDYGFLLQTIKEIQTLL